MPASTSIQALKNPKLSLKTTKDRADDAEKEVTGRRVSDLRGRVVGTDGAQLILSLQTHNSADGSERAAERALFSPLYFSPTKLNLHLSTNHRVEPATHFEAYI